MKCVTKDCENNVGDGNGLFLLIPQESRQNMRWICSPCWNYLTNGPTPKAMLRDAQASIDRDPARQPYR